MLVIGVSENIGQGSGQPTPLVHRGNMDNCYKPSPTCEGGQGSCRYEKRIPVPRYENELVPGGGPAI